MNKTKKLKKTHCYSWFCRYSNMQNVKIPFHIKNTAVHTVRLSCVSRTIRADREWTNEGQSNLGFVETAGAATIKTVSARFYSKYRIVGGTSGNDEQIENFCNASAE